jgi:hypothetical protein
MGRFRAFGQEATWQYQPGWTTETATSSETAETGIPYYLARPEEEVAVSQPEGESVSVKDWFGMGKDVVGTFVDIFGRPVGQQPPVQQARPAPGMPVWGWALIGIGGIAALGLTIRALRPSPRPQVAGRRRSRR